MPRQWRRACGPRLRARCRYGGPRIRWRSRGRQGAGWRTSAWRDLSQKLKSARAGPGARPGRKVASVALCEGRVGGFVEQRGQLACVAELDLEEPAFAQRVAVGQGGVVAQEIGRASCRERG